MALPFPIVWEKERAHFSAKHPNRREGGAQVGPRKLRPDVLSSWGRESPHTGHRWLPPSVDPSDGFSVPFPKSTLCESHVSLTSGAVFIVALIYSSSFLCLPPSGCCSPSGIHFGASYTGTWPGAGFLLCVSHGPLNGRQQVPTS